MSGSVRTALLRPRTGQVRVRQHAVGLDVRAVPSATMVGAPGAVAAPGGIVGVGAVGSIEAVGNEVVGFAVGDRVAYEGAPDAIGEDRILDAGKLVGIPQGVTNGQAAALLTKGLKARVLVKQLYPVGRGETVLVQAADRGIGAMVVAWAHALGATVIGVTDSASHVERVERSGAAHVIVDRPGAEANNVVSRVRELTFGSGVDVAYDGVGAATFSGSVGSTRRGGTVVLYAAPSGLPTVANLSVREVKVVRPTSAGRAHAGTLQLAAADVFLAIRDGVFSGLPITSYSIADAAEAHEDLALGRAIGSVVLLPLSADLAA